MKPFPFNQNHLRLLPFTIQSLPKALGLRKIGGHQGRHTELKASEWAMGKERKGQI